MDFILINRIGLVYNANWGVKSNYLIVKKQLHKLNQLLLLFRRFLHLIKLMLLLQHNLFNLFHIKHLHNLCIYLFLNRKPLLHLLPTRIFLIIQSMPKLPFNLLKVNFKYLIYSCISASFCTICTSPYYFYNNFCY